MHKDNLRIIGLRRRFVLDGEPRPVAGGAIALRWRQSPHLLSKGQFSPMVVIPALLFRYSCSFFTRSMQSVLGGFHGRRRRIAKHDGTAAHSWYFVVSSMHCHTGGSNGRYITGARLSRHAPKDWRNGNAGGRDLVRRPHGDRRFMGSVMPDQGRPLASDMLPLFTYRLDGSV